jgi:DNA-binding CsgD family transcriptional regulator
VLKPLISVQAIFFARVVCEWLALAGCGLFVHEWFRGRRRRSETDGKLGFLAETIPIAIRHRDHHKTKTISADLFTPRESDVLHFVAQGLANKEIAARLDLSESTVKGTLQQLFARTNVRTRTQLVKVALDHYQDALTNPPVATITVSPAWTTAPGRTPTWRRRNSRSASRIDRNRGAVEKPVMLRNRRSSRLE